MPHSLEKERIDLIRSQYEQQAKMYNIPFETFLGLMNITKEKFDEETEKQGKRQALFNVVLSKLIEVENLAPSKEALEQEALKDAEKQNSTREEMMKKNVSKYYSDLAYQAVVSFLLEQATIID